MIGAQSLPKLRIVGIGGTTSAASSTELALRLSLDAAEREGASVSLFGFETLVSLPHYRTPGTQAGPAASALVAAIRAADGIILASPGYHGSISGVVKNAIDHLEETARDEDRPYLDGVPVGLIATAYGWQAAATTLVAMRSIVHALRGWPTPFGVALNVSDGTLRDGRCTDPTVLNALERVAHQVVHGARQGFAPDRALAP